MRANDRERLKQFDRDCDELRLKILQDKRDILCKNLIPDRHFPYLRTERVLTLEDCEEINHEVTCLAKAGKFLDILIKKGAASFDSLCKSLEREKTQIFLLQEILKPYEEGYAFLKEELKLSRCSTMSEEENNLNLPEQDHSESTCTNLDHGQPYANPFDSLEEPEKLPLPPN